MASIWEVLLELAAGQQPQVVPEDGDQVQVPIYYPDPLDAAPEWNPNDYLDPNWNDPVPDYGDNYEYDYDYNYDPGYSDPGYDPGYDPGDKMPDSDFEDVYSPEYS